MLYLRPYMEELMEMYKLRQQISRRKIFLAAFAGTFLHITIDAFHHPHMPTFLPFDARPLFGLFSTLEVRALAFSCLVLGLPLYLWKVRDEIEIS